MKTVSSRAKIGEDVRIGDYSIVHDDVVLGDGVTIGSHCVIGEPTGAAEGPLQIGAGSTIRSHSVLYAGSSFGAGLNTGHHVLVRDGTRAGQGIAIGSYTDIEGDCTLGDWTRLHSGVHVARESSIGDLVFLFPGVQLTNDPWPPSESIVAGVKIEDMAIVCTNTLLLPGVTIGLGSFVAAGSRVDRDIPPVQCARGDPARVFCRLDRFFHPEFGKYHPWLKRFRSRYPEAAGATIDAAIARIDQALEAARAGPKD